MFLSFFSPRCEHCYSELEEEEPIERVEVDYKEVDISFKFNETDEADSDDEDDQEEDDTEEQSDDDEETEAENDSEAESDGEGDSE
jgi:hypothetical protein